MNPLTPLALIIVLLTAPIHYAFENPGIAAFLIVFGLTLVIGYARWRARVRYESGLKRKAERRARKIALIREAVRQETDRREYDERKASRAVEEAYVERHYGPSC